MVGLTEGTDVAFVQDRWFTNTADGTRVATSRRGTGKRWLACYDDSEGHRHTKAFERRVDAENFLVQARTDVLRGQYVDPERGRRTVGSFAAEWLAAQTFDPATRQQLDARLRNHILPVWKDIELGEVRPLGIQRWLLGLEQKLSPSTISVTFVNFSTILKAAVAEELIARNPAVSPSVTKPPVIRQTVVPWRDEQVRAVIAAHRGRYRALIATIAGAGLRQGEAFGLSEDDVDLTEGVIRVARQIKIVNNRLLLAPPKYRRPGEAARLVPISEGLVRILTGHMATYPPVEVELPWRDPASIKTAMARLIFTSRELRPLNKNYINAFIWKPALIEAGMPTARSDHNGMHALRHYCASNWLEHGVSIKAVADYLGHRDEAFTLRTYTHFMPTADGKARAADQLFSLQAEVDE
jgi:integrase